LFGDIGGAISDVGRAIDSTVRDVIPGGWATVAVIAAAVATGEWTVGLTILDPQAFGINA
jgi:hypothetical protein